ncbi:uncharacterized protein LOC122279416 isoform X1 [Carya illinoinensis]|uniref:Ribosomal protein L34Ae n=2 Tax=Carya illinoinensis TaxID=32201 RepID=A0A8T1RRV7_CARIL|nr:uncharacterized protein LOC122279416 isoform X1 [Carya illinoinensis]XP_042946015.1 uncharacterized protein LOC122279416 isoform X1 [Carya illinoinensis]XP_042946023.1 uncharacterized protein LOC122279416 isoform X1 [Carya illinoinensis]KAG6668953.1 hypothetical protein CIPAW_01G208800 [Carya illinoinensis]
MSFFKVRKFRKAHKPDPEKDLEEKPVPQHEQPKNGNVGDDLSKSAHADPVSEAEDDDDDFITDEVKRRLKELRRNSFMVLIPEEESCDEEEEEEDEEGGETSSSDWRDVEAEALQWWGGVDALYDKYCERMLFFDRMSMQQVNEVGRGCLAGSQAPATPSSRSTSKKLTFPIGCLSLKKIEEPNCETEHLQHPVHDPYQDIETAYVAQICLTWEALHCQYTQLSQKISSQADNLACYNHSAHQFQQFQVLLQRFIENEPFEEGLRAQTYARSRNLWPKLLQVPNIKASGERETEESSYLTVLALDLIKIVECSILTFHLFIKMDKKKSSSVLHLFGNQNQVTIPLQQIQSALEKKRIKLNELRKRRKGWKKNSWPQRDEDVELLFSLIDVKILSRVLRMVRITKEQLFWCEEKMKKLGMAYGKLRRDPSPILFPC